MSSAELVYWRAKYRLAPFGSRQEDLRAAYITSILYNSNRKKGSDTKPPEFFFPSLKAHEVMTPEERLTRQVQRAAEAFAGPAGA